MSQYKQQINDLKEITKPLSMGKAPHKIMISPDNYYGKSSAFRIPEIKLHHEVFNQREQEKEARIPYDIEAPLTEMNKRYLPDYSNMSPTSSIQKTKEDQKSEMDLANTLKFSISK